MIAAFPEVVTLVMIEDDAGHASLIKKNLARAGVDNDLVHFDDGAEALEYFFNPEGIARLPDRILVLLDLNLPKIDGYEVLRRLKSAPHTHKVPVIVLTTTDDPRDIDRCYELGCNVYITKPVEYENFTEAIRKLGLMLAVVKVPHIAAQS